MTFSFADMQSTGDGQRIIISEQDAKGKTFERLPAFRFIPVPQEQMRSWDMSSPMTLMQITNLIYGEVGPWSLVAFFNQLPRPWAQWTTKYLSARTIYYMDIEDYRAVMRKQRHP